MIQLKGTCHLQNINQMRGYSGVGGGGGGGNSYKSDRDARQKIDQFQYIKIHTWL